MSSGWCEGYLASRPDPAVYEFLRYDFRQFEARYGSLTGATFRNFPSFPQRYVEALSPQPDVPIDEGLRLERLQTRSVRTHYTDADLHVRRFTAGAARRLRVPVAPTANQHRAA